MKDVYESRKASIILLVLTALNTVMSVIEGNISAALGWSASLLWLILLINEAKNNG